VALPVDAQIETLRLLDEETKYRLSLQREATNRVETKTIVLVGFAATAAQVVAANRSSADRPWMVAALCGYAVAFIAGVWASRVRAYWDAPKVDALAEKYGDVWVEQALAALIGTRVVAVGKNGQSHRRRVRLWWLCLAGLTAGLVLSTIALWRGP
jgi:hypothetical protein